jgi:hypothetical protein
VFDGGFSERILRLAKPSRLVLIDTWASDFVWSGDVHGQNVRKVDGRELESTVRARFGSHPEIEVRRGTSDVLMQYPPGHFDAIYIDGDHSYGAVRKDLLAAWHAIKDGGWLMGHDYGVNPDKTEARWEFGVKRAVDDFCRDFDQNIDCFGLDGCTSFAVRIRKSSSAAKRLVNHARSLRTGVIEAVKVGGRRLGRTTQAIGKRLGA